MRDRNPEFLLALAGSFIRVSDVAGPGWRAIRERLSEAVAFRPMAELPPMLSDTYLPAQHNVLTNSISV